MSMIDYDAEYLKAEELRLRELKEADLNDLIKSRAELQDILDNSRGCRKFRQSKVGRFILDRAIRDSEQAKSELAEFNMSEVSSDTVLRAKIQYLQNRARVPVLMFAWIDEAIHAAVDAEIITSEEDAANEY